MPIVYTYTDMKLRARQLYLASGAVIPWEQLISDLRNPWITQAKKDLKL